MSTVPDKGPRVNVGDVVKPLLTALLTTAGIVGVVAATGGAVLWARFWAAGLPPGEALAVIPKTELIASGAATLALFILLALLAVVVMFALDAQGRPSTSLGIALCAFITVELLVVCLLLRDRGQGWILPAIVSLVPVVLAVWLHVWRSRRLAARKAAAETAARERAAARAAWAAWHGRSRVRKVHDRIAGTPAPPPVPPKAELLPVGATWSWIVRASIGLAVIVGVFYGFSQSGRSPGVEWVAASAVVAAVLLAGLCFAVADRGGGSFLVTATVVFFSILLFGSLVAIGRTVQHPKLSPIALLRKTADRFDGVLGFYVARTADRYWLAAVSSDCHNRRHVVAATGLHGRGRIFSLARDSVIDDEQGAMLEIIAPNDPDQPRAGRVDPNRQAQLLMDEVIRRRPPGSLPKEMVSGRKGAPGPYSRSLDPPVSPCRPKHVLQAHIGVGRSSRDKDSRLLTILAGPSPGKITRYDWTLQESGGGPRRTSTKPKFTYNLPSHSGVANVALTVSGSGGPSDSVTVRIRRLVDSTGWFRAGRARLTPKARARLRRFAELLDPDVIRKAYVDGRAHTHGPDDSELAERRAEQVVAALVRARPGLDRVLAAEHHYSSGITTGDVRRGPANRTIDIVVIGKETTV